MHPRQQDDQADIVYHEVAADIVKQIIESRVTFNKRFLQELLRSQQEFNEEMFINELRHQLLTVLESENFHAPLYKKEVYKHVYVTLIYLAKHWPFNEKGQNGYPLDYVSHQPIEQKNLFLTSTGYQFDVKHNKNWFDGDNPANPYNHQPFSQRDRQHLSVFFPRPAPEIDWIGGLLWIIGAALIGVASFLAAYSVILPLVCLMGGTPILAGFAGAVGAMYLNMMVYGEVGAMVGAVPFIRDVHQRFHHIREERHCRDEYKNLPEKIREMEQARNAPHIPVVHAKKVVVPPVSIPQSGLHSILNQHPGLNQFYAAKPVNDVKQEQKNDNAIKTIKPQTDLSEEPEMQLQLIKNNLAKYIIDLSANRELVSGLRQINGEIENISDAKFNVDKTIMNVSRLISRLKEIERTDSSPQEPNKYKQHHACVEFLETVKVDIPKLQKFYNEQIIPKKILKTLKM